MAYQRSSEIGVLCPNCGVVTVFSLGVLRTSKGEYQAPQTGLGQQAGFTEVQTTPQQAPRTAAPPPVQTQTPPVQGATVQDLLANIPDSLKAKITMLESPDTIKIQPKGWLGKQAFSVLNMAVRAFNGQYISEGKTSHWLIPKSKTMQQAR